MPPEAAQGFGHEELCQGGCVPGNHAPPPRDQTARGSPVKYLADGSMTASTALVYGSSPMVYLRRVEGVVGRAPKDTKQINGERT